ncbi:Hypothetical predicted protein [Podarcis lilfordi]|uniref:Uncharacterized protein n=1 Tax=Podarcis lilfordi TaxID=74358 RepID=A0AA35KW44_9SAUR|nr:Hypothetical predicted protein [Podarcis lilfordi]
MIRRIMDNKPYGPFVCTGFKFDSCPQETYPRFGDREEPNLTQKNKRKKSPCPGERGVCVFFPPPPAASRDRSSKVASIPIANGDCKRRRSCWTRARRATRRSAFPSDGCLGAFCSHPPKIALSRWPAVGARSPGGSSEPSSPSSPLPADGTHEWVAGARAIKALRAPGKEEKPHGCAGEGAEAELRRPPNEAFQKKNNETRAASRPTGARKVASGSGAKLAGSGAHSNVLLLPPV